MPSLCPLFVWQAVCVACTGVPQWSAHRFESATVLAKQLHDPLLLMGHKMDDLQQGQVKSNTPTYLDQWQTQPYMLTHLSCWHNVTYWNSLSWWDSPSSDNHIARNGDTILIPTQGIWPTPPVMASGIHSPLSTVTAVSNLHRHCKRTLWHALTHMVNGSVSPRPRYCASTDGPALLNEKVLAKLIQWLPPPVPMLASYTKQEMCIIIYMHYRNSAMTSKMNNLRSKLLLVTGPY